MITCITPSVRSEGLDIVKLCLKRQTYPDWEWVIVGNDKVEESMTQFMDDSRITFLKEPPKRKGDFYNLNKAWNLAYSKAKGDLIINIVDWMWFSPDILERLLSHYESDPKAIITCVGHQYDNIVNNKPENLVWSDPRSRTDLGSYYEVAPSEMEMCLCSIPRQAILDCGGLDEEYDKVPAVSEKEMCWRLDKLGYKFYIEQSIEYRAFQHPRLSSNWDELYKTETTKLFTRHVEELNNGTRKLNVGYVS